MSQAGCRSSGVRVNCGWAGLVSQAGCRSSGVRVNWLSWPSVTWHRLAVGAVV